MFSDFGFQYLCVCVCRLYVFSRPGSTLSSTFVTPPNCHILVTSSVSGTWQQSRGSYLHISLFSLFICLLISVISGWCLQGERKFCSICSFFVTSYQRVYPMLSLKSNLCGRAECSQNIHHRNINILSSNWLNWLIHVEY